MRQGNILNEATAVSLATFLGEAIRLVILIVALQSVDLDFCRGLFRVVGWLRFDRLLHDVLPLSFGYS